MEQPKLIDIEPIENKNYTVAIKLKATKDIPIKDKTSTHLINLELRLSRWLVEVEQETGWKFDTEIIFKH